MTVAAFQSGSSDAPSQGEGTDCVAQIMEDHCVFECGGGVLATSLGAVREVLSGKLATSVPQAPPALVGVVEMHGDVLAVVQLAVLIGIAAHPYTPANPIVVLAAHQTKLGIAVDRVRPVRAIDAHALTPATHHLYRGWCARTTPPVAVLNAEAVIAHVLRTMAVHLECAAPGNLRQTPPMKRTTSLVGS